MPDRDTADRQLARILQILPRASAQDGAAIAELAELLDVSEDQVLKDLAEVYERSYYLLAGQAFPDESAYEGFAQHENGIGMARAFYDELDRLERGTPLVAPEVTGEWRTVPAAPAEGYRAPRLADGAAGAGLAQRIDFGGRESGPGHRVYSSQP